MGGQDDGFSRETGGEAASGLHKHLLLSACVVSTGAKLTASRVREEKKRRKKKRGGVKRATKNQKGGQKINDGERGT